MSDQTNPASNDQPGGHSRRDFLRHSGLAAGAAAVAGGLLPASGVFAQSSDTIKVALVGCGGRGGGAAVNALETKGPVKLVAVADAFEDNAKGFRDNVKKQYSEKVDV